MTESWGGEDLSESWTDPALVPVHKLTITLER